MTINLQISLDTMTLKSPIVLLSGHVGFAEHLPKVMDFDWDAIGAVVLKATTVAPRDGYLGERIVETPFGLLNAVGLENPGLAEVSQKKIPNLPEQDVHWVVNVAGSTIQEYQNICAKLDDSLVSALEINISCPNVKQGGAVFGNDPILAGEVIAACRQVTSKSIIAKLSPNQTNICQTASSCIQSGASIISAINTVSAMAIDVKKQMPTLKGVQGGLSGSSIFPIALLNIYKIYPICKEHNIPIIGQGGISNGENAVAMLLAGASSIGLGTVLSRDINISRQIIQYIEKYCRQFGYSHVNQITGKLKL